MPAEALVGILEVGSRSAYLGIIAAALLVG